MLGDGLDLLGHMPHVVVVVTRHYGGAVDAPSDQNLGDQQGKPGFELAAVEGLQATSATG